MPLNHSVAINSAARRVTLLHPAAFNVVVSRKRVLRAEVNAGAESVSAAAPTLGGMGVMRSEDESEIDYEELGEGKMLFTNRFAGSDMIERDNGAVPELQREVVIESVKEPSEAGYFEADTGDLVVVDMGLGVVVAYDVASISTPTAIAPYQRRLILNPRDDLAYLDAFEE